MARSTPRRSPSDSLHPRLDRRGGPAEGRGAVRRRARAALAHAPVGGYRRRRGVGARTRCAALVRARATASAAPAGEETVLVMEPDIKAHFVISRSTPAYARLVDALPSTFVGTHQTLVRLVDFMCEQMNGSFRESGMSVPPWRKNKAILSKWFLPTATSRSHPTTPSGSPERTSQKLKKQDSGRRMSFAWCGGEVVGVGVSYGAGGATEEIAPRRRRRRRRRRVSLRRKKKKTQTRNARAWDRMTRSLQRRNGRRSAPPPAHFLGTTTIARARDLAGDVYDSENEKPFVLPQLPT